MSLGFDPVEEPLNLSLHADFIHELSAPADAEYPAGFTARIEILDGTGAVLATWIPVRSTTAAVIWNVQADTETTGVDAVIAARARRFRLYAIFPSTPTDDYLWYVGPIRITKTARIAR